MNMNATKCDVFICYRRKSASHAASRLYNRLDQAFPNRRIFLDTESIEVTNTYPEKLNENLHQCRVLIVLVDQEWDKLWNDSNNERNWIEIEIETALNRDIKILPLLLDGARLPDKLPESISKLRYIQNYSISKDYFNRDVSDLVDKSLKKTLGTDFKQYFLEGMIFLVSLVFIYVYVIQGKSDNDLDLILFSSVILCSLIVYFATIKRPKLDNNQTEPVSPKKRKFFSTALGMLIGGAGLGFSGRGIAEKHLNKTIWKMKSFTNEKNGFGSIMSRAPEKFKSLLEEMSSGKFCIEIDSVSKNADNDNIAVRVNDATFQCGISGIYYTEHRPGLYLGVGIPFGLNPLEQTAWLNYKRKDAPEGRTIMEEIYKANGLENIKLFPLIATGAQMGGWFKNEICGLEDFEEVTMRIPGLGATILNRMFPNAKPAPFDPFGGSSNRGVLIEDLPNFLISDDKNNKINAFEWLGPHDDLKLIERIKNGNLPKVFLEQFDAKKIDEVKKKLQTEISEYKYYYYPGLWEPGTTFLLQVNRDAWERLDDNLKKILEAACAQIYRDTLAEYEEKNSAAFEEILKREDIYCRPFPEEIICKAYEETQKYLNNARNESKFKPGYDEWFSFRDKMHLWSDAQYRHPEKLSERINKKGSQCNDK